MSSWLDEIAAASPMRSKIGWQGELEFAGATEDDRAGRTVTFRIVRRPEELGSAHPFATFTRRKGKSAGTIFEASIFSVAAPDKAAYSDQIMLKNWSDGPRGAIVQFVLDEGADTHPFLGYSRASKDSAGSRFMAVLLEKADDETIVDQEQQERAERGARTGRQQKTSNVAAMLIKEPRFHEYLRETVEAVDWNTALADRWLKARCKIDSKAALDVPAMQPAVAAFERIRKRFEAWREEQGDDLNPYHQ